MVAFKICFNTVGHSLAFKKQQKHTVVWTDRCLFVGQAPDDLKSALHGELSWLCLLGRVIVPVLSVSFLQAALVFSIKLQLWPIHTQVRPSSEWSEWSQLASAAWCFLGMSSRHKLSIDMQSIYALVCKHT